MADFCSSCDSELFNLEGKGSSDIDVKAIFHSLRDGMFMNCLCEGCGMLAVGKDGSTCIVYFGDFCPDISKANSWYEFDLVTNKTIKRYEKLDKKS